MALFTMSGLLQEKITIYEFKIYLASIIAARALTYINFYNLLDFERKFEVLAS